MRLRLRILRPSDMGVLFLAVLPALLLAACLPGAMSRRGFDFTESAPVLPFRDNVFDLCAAPDIVSTNAFAEIMEKASLVDGRGEGTSSSSGRSPIRPPPPCHP